MKDEEINKGNCDRLFFGNKIYKGLIAVGVLITLIVSGCEDTNKYSQCEQIFFIARNAHKDIQNKEDLNLEQPTAMKSWLTAATIMNGAANKMMALEIDNVKLISYRNKLATIYRLYSQATYDAVKARENKNVEALKAARMDAEQAGIMQQDLIQEINTYCLDDVGSNNND